MFSIFLWGKEREVFQLGVSGRKAIWWIKRGSFKDEGKGAKRGCFPRISNLTHFASLWVFISLYPQYISGRGDETGGRFNPGSWVTVPWVLLSC